MLQTFHNELFSGKALQLLLNIEAKVVIKQRIDYRTPKPCTRLKATFFEQHTYA